MDAIEQNDKDADNDNAKAAKAKAGDMAMRALGVVVLVAAMGAAAVGGAMLAVGQERLAAYAAGFFAKEETSEETAADGQAHIPLPETIYTLGGRGREQYLMATITLRADPRHENAVRERLPELQTVLHAFMRELTVDELTGATGLYQLRKACLHRARKVMGDEAIHDVFITEIMVQ